MPCKRLQVLHAAATIAPNQDLAFMLSLAWTALNLLMSGFFLPYNQVRLAIVTLKGAQGCLNAHPTNACLMRNTQFTFAWLSQLRWLSAQGYAFEALAKLELSGRVFSCAEVSAHRQSDMIN